MLKFSRALPLVGLLPDRSLTIPLFLIEDPTVDSLLFTSCRKVLFVKHIALNMFLLLASFSLFATAKGLPLSETMSSIMFPRDQFHCDSFSGNSNMYGLGIRLGIYFQWIASIATNRYIREQTSYLADLNATVLLALFLVTIQGVARHRLRPVEVVILLKICFGFILAALKYSSQPVSHWKSAARRVLATVIICFSIWFWARGLEYLLPDGRCDGFALYFARLPIRGSYHWIEMAFSIAVLPYYILHLFTRMLALVNFTWNGKVAPAIRRQQLPKPLWIESPWEGSGSDGDSSFPLLWHTL